jgi:hypothetical protein
VGAEKGGIAGGGEHGWAVKVRWGREKWEGANVVWGGKGALRRELHRV